MRALVAFVLECAAVTALVSVSVALLAELATRALRSTVLRLAPAARADLAFLGGVLPAGLSLAVLAATAAPSLAGVLGLAEDHCLHHGHHLHLCVVHSAGSRPVLAGVGGVWLAMFLVRAGVLVWRSVRLGTRLSALEALGTRRPGRFPLITVPGSPRLCHATGVLRRRIILSASLSEALSPRELRSALAHEEAHLRRRDPLAGWLLAVVGMASLPAAAQPVLTERQYVERVLASGLDARVAEGEAALGRAEAVGIGQWPNPSLEWQRESARLEGGGGETQDVVAVSVPLVLSGRLGLEAESAEQGARAAEARRDQARLRLWNEATRAFAAALGAQERRAILEDSLAAMKRLEVAIAAREKAGEAAGYDHLRVSLEASMVEDLLRGAVLEERKRKAEASRLLPPDSGELPPLQGPLAVERPLPAREELLSALEARPDVRAWELEARSAELARRAAGRGWIPEPTLNAGAQLLDVGRPGASTGYVVGLALPLPFFQHHQGEAARAEARRELAETSRAALLHATRIRLAAAHDEVTGRRERLALHRSSVLERTGELRRVAEAAYRGGSADLLVLVDAERASREARLAAVELSVSAIEAEAELLLLAGVPRDAGPRSTER